MGIFQRLVAAVSGTASATAFSTGDVALKWKVLTGNLGTTTTSVAHGVSTNIVGITAYAVNSGGTWVNSAKISEDNGGMSITYNTTNVIFSYQSTFNNNAYKIIVWYQ